MVWSSIVEKKTKLIINTCCTHVPTPSLLWPVCLYAYLNRQAGLGIGLPGPETLVTPFVSSPARAAFPWLRGGDRRNAQVQKQDMNRFLGSINIFRKSDSSYGSIFLTRLSPFILPTPLPHRSVVSRNVRSEPSPLLPSPDSLLCLCYCVVPPTPPANTRNPETCDLCVY